MEQTKFNEIAEKGMSMLRAAFSGVAPGELLAYNAYLHGQEVVMLGYQFAEDGHTYTKPLAIFVDQEVFDNLVVDEEGPRP